MSRVEWTDEQQAVIDARDCDLLVSAAAGSGKTAVLTERITRRVTDPVHPVDIERILVVTFTRAAAGEMKDRIAASIAAAGAERPEDIRLARQAALVYSAHIETIDSFCSWVVRSHFDEIGIEPDARVAEQVEMTLVKADVAKKVMDRWYEAAEPDFLDLVSAYSGINQDNAVSDLFLSIAEKADSRPDPAAWIESLKDPYTFAREAETEPDWLLQMIENARAEADSFAMENARLQELASLPEGPGMYMEALAADAALILRMTEAQDYESMQQALFGLEWAGLSRKKYTGDPLLKEEVKSRRDALKKRVTALAGRFTATLPQIREEMGLTGRFVDALCRLALDFLKAFAEEKRRRNVIDFSDMEHFALAVLSDEEGGPSEAAKALAAQFDEVMIDEYQDSNDLQEAILTLVSKLPAGGHNRFMVGDVKQSIYSFRQARPQLFTEKMAAFSHEPEAESRRIDLTKNFRSRRQVLDAANQVFERIMHEDLGGVEYDAPARLYYGAAGYEPEESPAYRAEILLAYSSDEDDVPSPFSADTPEEGSQEEDGELAENGDAAPEEEENRSPDTLLAEAVMIGNRIRQLMADPDFLITDRVDGETVRRPMKYGDAVILLRAPQSAGRSYADTLMHMGIPAYLPSADGFFTAPEIRVMLSLLSVIDNPLQDIPLAAVLRSPMVGLTDAQLWEIKRNAPADMRFSEAVMRLDPETEKELPSDSAADTGTEGAEERVQVEAAGAETEAELLNSAARNMLSSEILRRLDGFFALLKEARLDMTDVPIHTLIQALYRKTGYLTWVSAMPGGAQRRANLQQLADVAVRFESTSYRGLHHFMQYIRQMHKYDTDYGMAQTAEAQNAVQIISIHKSKGLEYPVVFVGGLHRKINLMDSVGTMVLHNDLGIGLSAVDLEARTRQKTVFQACVADRICADTRGEEMRVLYVAMTRAKEKLILTGNLTGKNLEKRLQDWQEPKALSAYARRSAVSMLDWVMPAALQAGAHSGFTVRYASERELAALCGEQDRTGEERTDLLASLAEMVPDPEMTQALSERLSFTYPWPVSSADKLKYSVSEIKHRMMELTQEDEAAALVWVSSGKPSDGALRGTATHRVMECFDFVREDYRTSLDEQMQQMEESGRLAKEQADLVIRPAVRRFLDSDLAARMHAAAAAGQYFKETPFFMGGAPSEFLPLVAPREDEEMIFVQGIIDAWFIEDGHIVLLDYKTDRVSEGSELVRRYEAQMKLYASALARSRHLPVEEVWLYSFALAESVPVKFN